MNDSECYRKTFLFVISFKWCSQNKFVSQFTCLWPHLYVKIHMPHTHISTKNDHEELFNWPEHNEFFNHFYFEKIQNMKGNLLINKMQSQTSNPISVLICCLYRDRSFML